MSAKKQLDPDQERDIRSYVNGDGHRWMPDFGDLSALLAAHDYWRDLAQTESQGICTDCGTSIGCNGLCTICALTDTPTSPQRPSPNPTRPYTRKDG